MRSASGAAKDGGGARTGDVQLTADTIAAHEAEAREAGIVEVVRLLSSPADLARLEQLRAEVSSKLTSARTALASSAGAQVEAARYGMALLDRSHSHVAKLRQCLDKVDALCAECAALVDNDATIRALSHAHANVAQVLADLGDIADLPLRVAAIDELLAAGDDGTVAAFEGLTVLQGTAHNIKEAWRRNARKQSDLGQLAQYLAQVDEAMARFEARLWERARDAQKLAQTDPAVLVDLARVVEMQEQMDAQYAATRATYAKPRHYRERLMAELAAGIAMRFGPLASLAAMHGTPNATVMHDQYGNVIVSLSRDYLGAITDVERRDAQGRRLPGATDAELAALEVREENLFKEDTWLEALLDGCSQLEAELAVAYDAVAPCFPPHFEVFDAAFQAYHVHFAQVMDTIGRVANALSTPGQLQLMTWVAGYQSTLRGLGVQEELVRLPVAPMSEAPEGLPGFDLLINSYADRMEAAMNDWCRAILAQDLAGQPQQMADGTLRTPGVVDFFRILNEQVSVLEQVSRGDAMLATARRCLKLMSSFVDQQRAAAAPGGSAELLPVVGIAAAAAAGAAGAAGASVSGPAAATTPVELGFEMVCALINNSVDCYNQSLQFTQNVQSLLDEGYRNQLDVEETCRAFLELAKLWASKLINIMFSDAGLVDQWRLMYRSGDWLTGQTTGTILATLGDYFTDVCTFVEPGFARRLADMALEEVLRRSSSAGVAALDRGPAAALAAMGAPGAAAVARGDPGDAVLQRLIQDERDVQVLFQPLLPPERLVQRGAQLAGLRELLDSRAPDAIVAGYEAIAQLNPAVTPAMVERLTASRPGLSKAQVADIALQARDVHARVLRRASAAGTAAGHGGGVTAATVGDGGSGSGDGGIRSWRLWGRGGGGISGV